MERAGVMIADAQREVGGALSPPISAEKLKAYGLDVGGNRLAAEPSP